MMVHFVLFTISCAPKSVGFVNILTCQAPGFSFVNILTCQAPGFSFVNILTCQAPGFSFVNILTCQAPGFSFVNILTCQAPGFKISGTAMGTKFAPPYACIFMDMVETEFLEQQEIIKNLGCSYGILMTSFLSG